MPRLGRVPWRRAGVCLSLTLTLAGCSATGSGSSSSSKNGTITATGSRLAIWLSVPPHASAAETDIVDAEKLAFAAQSHEVTRVGLELRVASRGEVSANARTAIEDKSSIAYLGELAPGASEDTIGITNALDLLQVSPTDTALEETQSTPAVPRAPDRYYETLSTYGRTFARVAPSSAAEAKAQVAEMKKLGVGTVSVTDDGTDYGRAIATAVRADATSAGLKVAATGADAVFVGARTVAAAASKFQAAAQAGPKGKLFGPSSLALSGGLPAALGSAGTGQVYVSVPSPAPGAASADASFTQAFKGAYGHSPDPQAVFGYEAMSAVLSVLREAGGSVADRSVVVRDFHRISGRTSVLGTLSIDKAGDPSLNSFRFLKLKDGALHPLAGPPVQG